MLFTSPIWLLKLLRLRWSPQWRTSSNISTQTPWSVLSANPNVYHSTCELFQCLSLRSELLPVLKAYLSRKLLVNRVTHWHPLAKLPKVYGHKWSCHVDYSKSFNPNISTTELRPWGFNFPTFLIVCCFFSLQDWPQNHLFNPFTPPGFHTVGQMVRIETTDQLLFYAFRLTVLMWKLSSTLYELCWGSSMAGRLYFFSDQWKLPLLPSNSNS